MKKNIIKLLSLVAVAMLGWSCETDYFNEHNLDGWEPETEITDVQTVEYALDAADYAAIASNATNKSIAEAAGAEAVAALEAVKTNGYFTSEIDAQTYLKAFVKSKYNNFFSNGSSVSVSYKLSEGYPEDIQAMNAAKAYTVSTDDYKGVWDEMAYIKAFSPATIDQLTTVVKTDKLEAGDYMVVTYNYTNTEPDFTAPAPAAITTASEPAITFPGAGKYLFVFTLDDGSTLAATPSDRTSGYFYPAGTAVTVADNAITADDTTNALAWEVAATATSGQYSIAMPNACYCYTTSDNYTSLNASTTLGDSGYFWTFVAESESKWVITSDHSKILQYSAQHSSCGAYPDERGLYPALYALNATETAYELVTASSAGSAETMQVYKKVTSFDGAGNYAIVFTNEGQTYLAYPIDHESSSPYYMRTREISIENDQIPVEGNEDAAWTFTATSTADQYTIMGSDGYYYCMKGTFSSFNSTQAADDSSMSYNWTVTAEDDGTFTIKNVDKEKWIQFDTRYSNVSSGTYTNPKPQLFKLTTVEKPKQEPIVPEVETEMHYIYYQWNGSALTEVEDLHVIQPADYTEMGQTYGSFSNSAHDTYIPKFLSKQLPYATEGTAVRVAYRYYQNDTTSFVVDEYIYDGTTWARNLNIEEGNAPFKKIDGDWIFDPSMTIILNPDKSEFSKKYYMAAFEYVYNNKNKWYTTTTKNEQEERLTDTEYYSGCAAGYTNLNWRINTLPKYYWGAAGDDITPYENWSAEDPAVAKACFEAFYAECEKRFGEVMAAALGTLHPNQKTIDGMDVIYTVQLKVYANAENLPSSLNDVTHAFEFKVVGDGQFEYVRMYALDPKFDLYLDFN